MTNEEVREELVVWLNQITGITVIKDRQSNDRPSLPYATVELAIVRDNQEHPSDIEYKQLSSENSAGLLEIEATPKVEQEWTFLVQVYGPNGFDSLRRVASAAHLPQMNENLMPRLTIQEVGAINNIPEFLGQHWETRAQTNITLRGMSDDGFVVDTIEEHTITISEKD